MREQQYVPVWAAQLLDERERPEREASPPRPAHGAQTPPRIAEAGRYKCGSRTERRPPRRPSPA
jgi:hypothetical protein